MSIAGNLARVKERMRECALHAGRSPEEISFVAVTKGCPFEFLLEAYQEGVRDFGESRMQEALPKIEKAPQDIRWHFIGRLQKNKVAKAIGRFALIHSVENVELAKKISEESQKRGVTTSVLLEVNTSGEEAKGGLPPDLWKKEFSSLLNLKGIEIEGLMTIAPLTDEETLIRSSFASLRELRDALSHHAAKELPTLSMGMSNDFPIAIQEGATLLRLGSVIFSPQ